MPNDNSVSLETTDDDTLIYIFAFLSIPDLLVIRQTCKRLFTVSKLRIVWHNACTIHVLGAGFPFPSLSTLSSLGVSQLETRTRRHYRIGQNWVASVSGSEMSVEKMVIFDAAASTIVSDVRFVPGTEGKWLLTVSKGIWSGIALWDIGRGLRKLAEWSEKGAIFNRFTVNTDPHSESKVAVSVFQDGRRRIQILGLECDESGSKIVFKAIASMETFDNPMALHGDLLLFSDDSAKTIVLNWKCMTWAALLHPPDNGQGVYQHDRCIQVVLAYRSVLVVRARSIHLFPEPVLRSSDIPPPLYTPFARHSWGWLDGVAVTVKKSLLISKDPCCPIETLFILIRAEVDDPWATDNPTLDLYTLEPNPEFSPLSPCDVATPPGLPLLPSSVPNTIIDPMRRDPTTVPYVFPPVLCSQVKSVGGPLQCKEVMLGQYGTAVWIHPRARTVTGLAAPPDPPDTARVSESLMAAVFPGLLNAGPVQPNVLPKTLWTNSFNNWTSIDYDEELGKIALGSSYGRVTLLDL